MTTAHFWLLDEVAFTSHVLGTPWDKYCPCCGKRFLLRLVAKRPGCTCLKEVDPSGFLHYQDKSPSGLKNCRTGLDETRLDAS